MSARPVALVTAVFDSSVGERLGRDVDLRVLPAAANPEPLTSRLSPPELAPIEIIVCESDVVDAGVVASCPRLRLVISCRANPVNVDVDACRAAGVLVATTPARNADVTADLAMALMLAVVRRTSEAERWMRGGAWVSESLYEPYTTFRGMGLTGRLLGLVGAGAVGRRVAQRARGFGMEVIAFDPYAKAADTDGLLRLTSLDEVMSRSDVVSIHAPLNDATRGLIGTSELALLRPTAYLVNAGRAAIVDEEALVAVARAGSIAGLGLDVFWTEPPPATHPLMTLPNVVVTPHIGGASDDVVVNHSHQAAKAIEALLLGHPVPSLWAH